MRMALTAVLAGNVITWKQQQQKAEKTNYNKVLIFK